MPFDDLKNKKKLGEMMTESLSPQDSALNAPAAPEQDKSLYQEYLKPLIEEKMRQKQQEFQQDVQTSKDNSAIMNDKFKMAMNPALQGPPQPGLFDERLPAEKEQQQKYMQLALGTMGSSGGGSNWMKNPKNIEAVKNLGKNVTEGIKGRAAKAIEGFKAPGAAAEATVSKELPYGSKWSSPEALETYLADLQKLGKNTTEGLVPKVTKSVEGAAGEALTKDPGKLDAASEMLTRIMQDPSIPADKKQAALSKFALAAKRATSFGK